MILDFIISDIGTGIAWLCTVGSVIYSIIKSRENKVLQRRIEIYESVTINDNGQDRVTQNGENSVYTKHNSGGMNIKM